MILNWRLVLLLTILSDPLFRRCMCVAGDLLTTPAYWSSKREKKEKGAKAFAGEPSYPRSFLDANAMGLQEMKTSRSESDWHLEPGSSLTPFDPVYSSYLSLPHTLSEEVRLSASARLSHTHTNCPCGPLFYSDHLSSHFSVSIVQELYQNVILGRRICHSGPVRRSTSFPFHALWIQTLCSTPSIPFPAHLLSCLSCHKSRALSLPFLFLEPSIRSVHQKHYRFLSIPAPSAFVWE